MSSTTNSTRDLVIAAAATCLANGGVYGAVNWLAPGALQVTEGPGATALVPLQLRDVIVASLIPVVPAAIVWLVLRRVAARPRRAFVVVAVLVLLLSLVPVALLPSGAITQLALATMHVLSATALTLALARRSA